MAVVLPVETLVEEEAVAVQPFVDMMLHKWVMVSVLYLLVKVVLLDLVEVMEVLVSILNSIQTQVSMLQLHMDLMVELVVILVLLFLVEEEELGMVI